MGKGDQMEVPGTPGPAVSVEALATAGRRVNAAVLAVEAAKAAVRQAQLEERRARADLARLERL